MTLRNDSQFNNIHEINSKLLSLEVELSDIKRKCDELDKRIVDFELRDKRTFQDKILDFFTIDSLNIFMRNFSIFSYGWAKFENVVGSNTSAIAIEKEFIDAEELLVVVSNFVPEYSGTNLLLQFKISNNWITSGYQWGGLKIYGGGGAWDGSTSANGIVLATNISNASSHLLFAEARIFLPIYSGISKIVRGSSFYVSSGGTISASETVGFLSGNTGIIQGVRIVCSSGNISSGRLIIFSRQRK